MAELFHIEAVYEKYARFYDAVFGPFFEQGQKLAVRMMNIKPGEKILEVGIGTGALLPFYPRDVNLTGIDISEGMLDRARLLKRKLGMENVSLKRMDATKMDFPDGCFDKVMAAYVISVVPDPVGVAMEMQRVCKEGGEIFFINHFQSERGLLKIIEGVISPVCDRIGFRTDLKLSELVREAGLDVVARRRVNLFGLWQIVKCRVGTARPQ